MVDLCWFMVFNTTFNNISVISWQSVLLVEETRVPVENNRPVNWKLIINQYWQYSDTCLNQTLNKTEYCINQITCLFRKQKLVQVRFDLDRFHSNHNNTNNSCLKQIDLQTMTESGVNLYRYWLRQTQWYSKYHPYYHDR